MNSTVHENKENVVSIFVQFTQNSLLKEQILHLFKSKGSEHSGDNLNFVHVNMAIPGYYIMILCLTALSHPVLEFF